jgi:2-epi-5-epi-valiolone 7-kinase
MTPQTSRTPVLAFDIGGTWFRSALVVDGDVSALERRPAISYRTSSDDVEVLQRRLLDYLVTVARDAARRLGVTRAAVSLGAAMNGRSGLVLASAPLWGPAERPFDLHSLLRSGAGDIEWVLVNDVTALAASLLVEGPRTSRKAAALTVSSGIAYRTIELETGHIPFDPEHGLQGEIGHLPVEVHWRSRPLHARCDCGVEDHLSAFCSGRGIEALLARLPEADGSSAGLGGSDLLPRFASAVKAGDARALELLDLFTRPLAQVLLYQSTLDPEVGRTVLSGGVVDALEDAYLQSLKRNMHAFGLYMISHRDPGYFDRRLALARGDGLDALRGAGVLAHRGAGATSRRGTS